MKLLTIQRLARENEMHALARPALVSEQKRLESYGEVREMLPVARRAVGLVRLELVSQQENFAGLIGNVVSGMNAEAKKQVGPAGLRQQPVAVRKFSDRVKGAFWVFVCLLLASLVLSAVAVATGQRQFLVAGAGAMSLAFLSAVYWVDRAIVEREQISR